MPFQLCHDSERRLLGSPTNEISDDSETTDINQIESLPKTQKAKNDY